MTTTVHTRPLADAEQDELALLDASFLRAFGSEMAAWDPETRALYNDAIGEIYARYPQETP